MKRSSVFLLGLTLIILTATNGAFAAADKFAYVDLSRIFSEYGKTKEYDKVLADKEQAYNSERTKKINDIKQFQDKINLLSDKEKEAKKGDLENKIKNLQEFDRQQQTDLRKDQGDKMKELLKDIENAVKQYAEKEGYTMVFNDRVLIYQAKDMDITDKVVAILSKSYKK